MEPWGCLNEDYRAAVITASIFRAQGSEVTVRDILDNAFTRGEQKVKVELTDEEIEAKFNAAVDRHNSRVT